MCKFAFVVALVATLALAPRSASAGFPHVVGQGTHSCTTWVHDRLAERRKPSLHVTTLLAQEQAWVLGFLSGVAIETEGVSDPLKGMAEEGIWSWIDGHCRDHPLENIVDAAISFRRAHP